MAQLADEVAGSIATRSPMNDPIHLMTPELRANPYPFYAEMRRARPVVQVEPAGMWAVSRHEDVAFVLKHPELFSSQGFRAAWEPAWLGYNPIARSILAMDGAPHAKLRAFVTRAFGARALARIEPRIRELAAGLAGELAAAGEADFISTFALPLPAFVIADLLGLDRSLWRRFKQWADDVVSVTPVPQSPEQAARVRASIAELTGYCSEVIAARRRAPIDDFMSDLIRAEVDGQSLSDEELVSFAAVLLLGGFDTTTYLLANAVRILAERPELTSALRADPAAIAGFVEEVLRFDAPVHGLPRIALEEVTLGGATVPRGSLVLALIGSANRDERAFQEPDRFNMRRGEHGIPFGFGIHACIGAGLARLEARLSLEALLARARGFIRPPGELEWNCSLTVRGPVAMPIRLVPGPAEA
jgi:cytochrome P450